MHGRGVFEGLRPLIAPGLRGCLDSCFVVQTKEFDDRGASGGGSVQKLLTDARADSALTQRHLSVSQPEPTKCMPGMPTQVRVPSRAVPLPASACCVQPLRFDSRQGRSPWNDGLPVAGQQREPTHEQGLLVHEQGLGAELSQTACDCLLPA